MFLLNVQDIGRRDQDIGRRDQNIGRHCDISVVRTKISVIIPI